MHVLTDHRVHSGGSVDDLENTNWAQEIEDVIEGFAHAAEYLEKAGYDGIQLHCAHGYLLAQFISQTTNKRTDKYGGSLANRARVLIDIANAIRKRTNPDFILSIKLNSVEFQEDGIQPEEARELCAILEQNRFDFVELSGGTYQQLAFERSLPFGTLRASIASLQRGGATQACTTIT